MRTFVIDNGSLYQKELLNLLHSYNPEIVAFGELNIDIIPADSFVVLSGGHTIPVLWHEDKFAHEIKIVKKHSGPILGVCLGAELIAHAFGSHLHLLEKRRRGLIKINTTNESDILIGENDWLVHENHRWSIEDIHSPLIALATSKDGIEIFKHKTRPIYGLQFHPESSIDNEGRGIYERVLNEFGI